MKPDSRQQKKTDNDMEFDQFDEPKAMSVGWDLSNLPSNSGSKANSKDLLETRRVDGDQTPEVSGHTDAEAEHHPEADIDTFPEPRTVPTKWNVSALL